jgi:hypothetical protein
VLPLPAASTTLAFDADQAEALSRLAHWAGRPLPISASAWHAGRLTLRLAGARAAVQSAAARLGGRVLDDGEAQAWWCSVRDQRHPSFTAGSGGEHLWRLSLPATTPPLALPGECLVEWGGALRWLRSDLPVAAVRDAAVRAGGHATLMRRAPGVRDVFTPLPPALLRIHRALKQAFDPHGLFNRGRLYADL